MLSFSISSEFYQVLFFFSEKRIIVKRVHGQIADDGPEDTVSVLCAQSDHDELAQRG